MLWIYKQLVLSHYLNVKVPECRRVCWVLVAYSNDPGYEQVISNYILIYLERTLGSI